MRQIKFKAWDEINKQMIPHELLAVGLKNINKVYGKKQFTYLQATGVFDKNGIEIYESDILRYGEDCIRVIIYEQAAFHARPHNYQKGNPTHPLFFTTLQPDNNMQVIGNIWETPELLNPIK